MSELSSEIKVTFPIYWLFWMFGCAVMLTNIATMALLLPLFLFPFKTFQWHCQSARGSREKASRLSDLSFNLMINRGNRVDKHSSGGVVIPFPALGHICQHVFTASRTSLLMF